MKYPNSLKRYRQFAGLSQKKLADLSGIKLETYRAKEQGRTSFKDPEKVVINEILSRYINNASIEALFFS